MKNSKPQQNYISCSHFGCNENAEYKAPKSKIDLESYDYYCLEHIRQFNKSWNFFDGKSDEEIIDFQHASLFGHRETNRFGVNFSYENISQIEDQLFNSYLNEDKEENIRYRIPEEERKALSTIELKYPTDGKTIKKKYKELAKKYHPDIKGKDGEERLKKINQAYNYLKSCNQYDFTL